MKNLEVFNAFFLLDDYFLICRGSFIYSGYGFFLDIDVTNILPFYSFPFYLFILVSFVLNSSRQESCSISLF